MYDAASGQASLTQPAMTIATTADLPAGKQLNAGLGILGVKVVGAAGTADYRLESSVATTWANPDNDAAASLAYDNPATAAADDGELAADGAGTGLVTATRTGSLTGHLVAEPRANDLVAGLPSVGATVDLTSTAPATFDAPAVTAVVPDAAKPFLTLTPRDLAAGLSQAASAILGMQDAKDGNLPLMRGSIGNAIDAVGGIKVFLADQVPDADPDDQTPGQPKFASLQDMLAALDTAAYAGSGLDHRRPRWARTPPPSTRPTRMVNFTVRTTRGGVSDLELNILGAATTGTGTYTATGLSATGVDFDGPQGTSGADLVGRRVTAGTSYGTVASITDDHALTLTADGWSGGQPANGTRLLHRGGRPEDRRPGVRQHARRRHRHRGRQRRPLDRDGDARRRRDAPDGPRPERAADLRQRRRRHRPRLRPRAPSTAPCPFQQVDASGLGRVITSLPLASDRILLRQSARDLLVADADITSPVQINTSSGFLALSVGGDVDADRPRPASTSRRSPSRTPATSRSRPSSSRSANRPSAPRPSTDDVFSQTLGGSVSADLDISVDDAPDAFADGENSTSLTLTATVADLADGIGDGDVTVTARRRGPRRPAQGAQLRAEQPDLALRRRPGGVPGRRQRPHDDDGRRARRTDPAGRLVGRPAHRCRRERRWRRHLRPARRRRPMFPPRTSLTDASADFGPDFIGRQIVVGSTTATIVDAAGPHPDPRSPARQRSGGRDAVPRGERAPRRRARAAGASTPATLAGDHRHRAGARSGTTPRSTSAWSTATPARSCAST